MAISNDTQGGTAATTNEALTPLADSARVFHWHDHLSLWFSLGVGLLVMQVGAFLVPAVGTRDAVIAILLGSVVGAGLLAVTCLMFAAFIWSRTGPTAAAATDMGR